MVDLETNNIIAFVACLFFLFIIGKIFIVPIKTILRLIMNSILGGFIICIINFVGGFFNFHIGLNIITSIFVGLLGIPGAVVVILIKLLLSWFCDIIKILTLKEVILCLVKFFSYSLFQLYGWGRDLGETHNRSGSFATSVAVNIKVNSKLCCARICIIFERHVNSFFISIF